MNEDQEVSSSNGDGSTASRPSIPPPAFPPGSRRREMRQTGQRATPSGEGYISPDEPMPARAGSGEGSATSNEGVGGTDAYRAGRADMESAFISPDDPMPQRSGNTALAEETDAGEVSITGMGSDAHLGPEEMAAGGDPHVLELVHKVNTLAQALRQKGEAGLRSTPEMDRFESTLRGYCVGYLAGRRAEDDS